jgi:2-oxoglutarate dehydrogenase E1 component
MNIFDEFHGPNAGYVLDLYERYRTDPDSVPGYYREYFKRWKQPANGGAVAAGTDTIAAIVSYAQSIREYGHLAAALDPLGSPPPGDPSLELRSYGLSDEDLSRLPASLVGGAAAENAASALDAVENLRSVYMASTGFDFEHILSEEERTWLRNAAERRSYHPLSGSAGDGMPYAPREILRRLTQVEAFEQFLHRMFPGKTRFSIEGLDVIIPMLDYIVKYAGGVKIRNILIGMAHRGRLNVLAHILQKPYSRILAEFKDPLRPESLRYDLGWTGDVKYHKGAWLAAENGEAGDTVIKLAPNPSHLEHVNPVVEGMARAAGTRAEARGEPEFDYSETLPLLIHGDASFPAQGVVAETLNFSRLPGYRTGGTIHIIANNQLGYTTPPQAGRSTLYASDLAKGFEIPVIHVNADDVERCIEAARLAFAYRNRFKKDIVVDVIGYRRYGHNEGDEPSFTQPRLYRTIKEHPPVRELFARKLVERSVVDENDPGELMREWMDELQNIYESIDPGKERTDEIPESPPPGAAKKVATGVPLERLRRLNDSLKSFPEGFTLNPKMKKYIGKRKRILDDENEPTVDWSAAEELAFASILEDGIPIRLTGEDTERGTFSQRHAAFHDAETGERYAPLQHLASAKASFEVCNSPLSENAALGFEYGYNIQAPGRLVIWEAQYGDFINVPQAMIDEFLTSAREKWGQTPSLVLLLPHGLEGQGPDHSSAQPERFLQLAANINMRIANCTTAAQYFHLLRRQAMLLKTDPLPLVVFTPKSLLRNPLVRSAPAALAGDMWMPVIDDETADKERIRHVLLCTGKIYTDLIAYERRKEYTDTAIVRIEQLYRFPAKDICGILESYRGLERVVWVQEEPENMGAWRYVRPLLGDLCGDSWELRYFGRPENSSAGEGSHAWFSHNQKALVEYAFRFADDLPDGVWLKKM